MERILSKLANAPASMSDTNGIHGRPRNGLCGWLCIQKPQAANRKHPRAVRYAKVGRRTAKTSPIWLAKSTSPCILAALYSIEPRSAFTTQAWPCCSMLSTLP